MHMVRDCDEVRDLWYHPVHPDHWRKFFSIGISDWLHWNLPEGDIGVDQQGWIVLFGVTCWSLQNNRNLFVFHRIVILQSDLIQQIQRQTREIELENSKLGNSSAVTRCREAHIAWVPPLNGDYMVNIDESHRQGYGRTSCGGLVWDNPGRFIKGFHCNLGPYSAILARMWAPYHGVQMAKQLSLRSVMDSTICGTNGYEGIIYSKMVTN